MFRASGANSCKCELAAIYLATAAIGCCVLQFLRNGKIVKVIHSAALGADEVNVGVKVAIEPLNTLYGAEAGDQALLFKKREVTVYRS